MSAEANALLLRTLGLTTAARLDQELTRRAESEDWGYHRETQRMGTGGKAGPRVA